MWKTYIFVTLINVLHSSRLHLPKGGSRANVERVVRLFFITHTVILSAESEHNMPEAGISIQEASKRSGRWSEASNITVAFFFFFLTPIGFTRDGSFCYRRKSLLLFWTPRSINEGHWSQHLEGICLFLIACVAGNTGSQSGKHSSHIGRESKIGRV